MVHIDKQKLLTAVLPPQGGPEQGGRSQIKGPQESSLGFFKGDGLKPLHIEQHILQNLLADFSILHDKGGAEQGFLPHQLFQSESQPADIRLFSKPEHTGHIVGQTGRIQLGLKIQALLGGGQRIQRQPRGFGNDKGLGAGKLRRFSLPFQTLLQPNHIAKSV